ncbi:DUF3160 domain-containing protein [Parablautia muri]|nr:DUF3160 domain-containing protein [Parablautia muri]
MIKIKKKFLIASILSISIITNTLSACSFQNRTDENAAPFVSSESISSPLLSPEQDNNTQAQSTPSNISAGYFPDSRPLLITGGASVDTSSVVPCIKAYTINPDLSNISNLQQFYLTEEMAEKLARNGFVVQDRGCNEFFELYEINRYAQIPNFVTVDSLMHTYHLYFSYLLKNIERTYLKECMTQLSGHMLADSMAQYDRLKGSQWESAARRNVAFFAVGAKLLDENTEVPDYVKELAGRELESIAQATGNAMSELAENYEDYSQYIPRGYYEGDSSLEQYFKAMMWYGRIHFPQDKEDMNRSALLMIMALSKNQAAYDLWESAYVVTSFFAGASDDNGVCEYASAIRQIYGDSPTLDTLLEDENAFSKFQDLIALLPAPQINSIPIDDGEDNVIPGFRFMGQRFTIDGTIMQNLIYQRVGENSSGQRRMLPDVLDVPAALGSDMALRILEDAGAADYAGYSQNMDRLKQALSKDNEALWSASLYAGWLNTLRPLLTAKGEGYPVFMQNEEWLKKDLECFAGSFTELKHDTILYSKQVLAEMGGGEEEQDDRGYVEPEPLVYARFAFLADQTAQGLASYGMLTEDDKENLSRLSYIANQLLTISNKELTEELLTDEEYDFIRYYGGTIEHFWYETIKNEGASESISTQEYPAGVVVDIATDPNGQVLEAATDNPSSIYVVVQVDGKLKIAKGTVYSFYQFPWPLSDRLTDTKWRQMMGMVPDETGYYNFSFPLSKPDWTYSYRCDSP